MILKPFLINFKHWKDLMNSTEADRYYIQFWFYEVMNRLSPQMYKDSR